MAGKKKEEETDKVPKAPRKKATKVKKGEETIDALSVKGLFGAKLMDAGVDTEGWSVLYFSNGYELKLKGNAFLIVKESRGAKK